MRPVKPVAALSASLLVRKGVKDARHSAQQSLSNPVHGLHHELALGYGLATGQAGIPAALEDLGWSDLGEEWDDELDPVVDATPDEVSPNALRAAISPSTPQKYARGSILTLHLDPQRHLKLRLACTLDGQSPQVLLTAALDRLLMEYSQLEPLTAQVRQLR